MNKYLKQYTESGILNLLEYYLPIKKIFERKKANKEITEAFAVINILNREIKYQQKDKEIAIFDLGCGKGYFSMLSSWIFSYTELFACDYNTNMDIGHFDFFSNVTYEQINLFDTKIINFINELDYDEIILVGIHSCKQLAIRNIELFNQTKAQKLILIPCCELKNPYKRQIYGIGNHYDAWSLYLFNQILTEHKIIKKDLTILSPKNNVIYAYK